MTDPTLVAVHALKGQKIGISVSDSADLGRLGLTKRHCELAVAEIARAILLTGGSVIYGGRIHPEGFTQIIMDEVRRYADGRHSLTICLAESEHRDLTEDELQAIEGRLGVAATLVCLDSAGNELPLRRRPAPAEPVDPAQALTALRQYITEKTDARVIVGGQLTGYQGVMPGVIEEALLSVRNGQPLYIAAGFGGAAAAIARTLDHELMNWAPVDLPVGAQSAAWALQELSKAAKDNPMGNDGLSSHQRAQLRATHRPADIAALVVYGLARRRQQ